MKEKYLKQIPKNYNPYIHLSIPSLFGIIILFISIFLIKSVQWWEFLSIPVVLFGLFGFEWLVHKQILHHPRKFLTSLYDKHEIAHHNMYHHDSMAFQELRELYFILMPTYAIFLVFLLMVPIVGLLILLTTTNIALFALITSMAFFLMYEWLHFIYHMPIGIWNNNFIIAKLKQLHTTHHNPFLMKHFNFNVTFPVFDLILKTYYK